MSNKKQKRQPYKKPQMRKMRFNPPEETNAVVAVAAAPIAVGPGAAAVGVAVSS